MKRWIKILNLQGVSIPLVVCLLGVGCVGNFKKDVNDTSNVIDDRFIRLEEENQNLLNEVAMLRNNSQEVERLRNLAESSLSGSGITVGVRGNDEISLTLPSSVFFSPGKTSLKKSAKSNLRKISTLINQQFYSNTIRIEGYTDNQPIKKQKKKHKTNWELSVARAISVLYYLTKECGVNPSNMYVAGFGENNPIASNSLQPKHLT